MLQPKTVFLRKPRENRYIEDVNYIRVESHNPVNLFLDVDPPRLYVGKDDKIEIQDYGTRKTESAGCVLIVK